MVTGHGTRRGHREHRGCHCARATCQLSCGVPCSGGTSPWGWGSGARQCPPATMPMSPERVLCPAVPGPLVPPHSARSPGVTSCVERPGCHPTPHSVGSPSAKSPGVTSCAESFNVTPQFWVPQYHPTLPTETPSWERGVTRGLCGKPQAQLGSPQQEPPWGSGGGAHGEPQGRVNTGSPKRGDPEEEPHCGGGGHRGSLWVTRGPLWGTGVGMGEGGAAGVPRRLAPPHRSG